MNDLNRLRKEYEDRKRRFAEKDIYSWFNRANLFTIQQRQRNFVSALKKAGMVNLAEMKILDLGCGTGGVLSELLCFGAPPQNLYGIDLLKDRLDSACARLPASHLINADGQRIPFPARSFDMVIQYTALSSILSDTIRREIASDMVRVLKPNGHILWYDFWLNPTNPQTRGIRPSEIRGLFPGCKISLRRVTLAPPIARMIVPIAWGLALTIESLGIFNSHYFGIISPSTPHNST